MITTIIFSKFHYPIVLYEYQIEWHYICVFIYYAFHSNDSHRQLHVNVINNKRLHRSFFYLRHLCIYVLILNSICHMPSNKNTTLNTIYFAALDIHLHFMKSIHQNLSSIVSVLSSLLFMLRVHLLCVRHSDVNK